MVGASSRPLPVGDDPFRPFLSVPFPITAWGNSWVAGTDGHCAAAVLGTTTPVERQPPLAELLPKEWTPRWTTTLAELRAWLGEREGIDCRACEGRGREDCGCPNCVPFGGGYDCRSCAGSGKTWKRRVAPIALGWFNRDVLLRAVASAPAEGVVEVWQKSEANPIVLRSGDWLGVAMGMVRAQVLEDKLVVGPALELRDA